MKKAMIPFTIFMVLAIFLGIGLSKDPRAVPSPFIGKLAPEFTLPQLGLTDTNFSTQQMLGKVWLLNIWASWCVSCRAEHEVLNRLTKKHTVNLVGLNYKDKDAEAMNWLKQYGNPYQVNVVDSLGQTGIDWGVYAVPETFVIDHAGIIRHKLTGPVTDHILTDTLLPLIRQLESQIQ